MSTPRRLGLFGSGTLALVAGALALAGPASAGPSPGPQPCLAFTSCTPVIGGWSSEPRNGDQLYTLACPSGLRAVGADAAFTGAVYPVGITVVGLEGPGSDALIFGPMGDTRVPFSFKPGIGCVPLGATLTAARSPVGRTQARVRTVRLRPGRPARLGRACARGERLVHQGSSVVFHTRRAPAAAVVRSLRHRNRRVGSSVVAEATAPRGVGDDERVELQVTAVCQR